MSRSRIPLKGNRNATESRLVKRALAETKGNLILLKKMFTEMTSNQWVTIFLRDGKEISGKVINMFYPLGEVGSNNDEQKPYGVRLLDNDNREIARYEDIQRFKIQGLSGGLPEKFNYRN